MPDTLSLSAGVSLGLLAGIVSGVCYLVANGLTWPKAEEQLGGRCIASSKDDGVCRRCGGDTHGGIVPCICQHHQPVKFESGAWFLRQVQKALSLMPWTISTDRLEQIEEEHEGRDSPGPGDSGRNELRNVREFLEALSARLAGGPLEGTRVTPLYDHPACLPPPRNESPSTSSSHSQHASSGASGAHAQLKRLVARVVEEAAALPALARYAAEPSPTPPLDSSTYEDLLATAILNKVIERYQNESGSGGRSSGIHSASASPSPSDRSSPRSLNSRHTRHVTPPLREEEDVSDWEEGDAAEDAIELPRRVPFPEFGGDIVHHTDNENRDFDEVSGSDIQAVDGSWEENWLFQKKKIKTIQSVPVPMLVPNSNTEYRALIGDRDADDTTDLSDNGSDPEEDQTEYKSDMKKVLDSKHVIGGKTKVDEILDFEPDSLTIIDGSKDFEIYDEEEYMKSKNLVHAINSEIDKNSLIVIEKTNNATENTDNGNDSILIIGIDSGPLPKTEFSLKEEIHRTVINGNIEEYSEDLNTTTNGEVYKDIMSNLPNNKGSTNTISHHEREGEYEETVAKPVQRYADSLRRKHFDDEPQRIPTRDTDKEEDLIPGSIAYRERKKWLNCVEMPNNPYSPEAIQKRLTAKSTSSLFDMLTTKDKDFDDDKVVISEKVVNGDKNLDKEIEKDDILVKDVVKSKPVLNVNIDNANMNGIPSKSPSPRILKDVLAEEVPQYKRYGRDYYIREAKASSGGRKRSCYSDTSSISSMNKSTSLDNFDTEVTSPELLIKQFNTMAKTEQYKIFAALNQTSGSITTGVNNKVDILIEYEDVSEQTLFSAKPALVDDDTDIKFEQIFQTAYNTEIPPLSIEINKIPDEPQKSPTNLSFDNSYLSSTSSLEDSIKIYNVQTGEILKSKPYDNVSSQYLDGNDNIDILDKNSLKKDVDRLSLNSDVNEVTVIIENLAEEEEKSVKSELDDILPQLPKVKELAKKFINMENSNEIVKRSQKLSLSKSKENLLNDTNTENQNLKYMQSSTARSISKEIREEVKYSPEPLNGNSKEISDNILEPPQAFSNGLPDMATDESQNMSLIQGLKKELKLIAETPLKTSENNIPNGNMELNRNKSKENSDVKTEKQKPKYVHSITARSLNKEIREELKHSLEAPEKTSVEPVAPLVTTSVVVNVTPSVEVEKTLVTSSGIVEETSGKASDLTVLHGVEEHPHQIWRRMSKENILSSDSKSDKSKQLYMHSLTARSISKEFREELKQSMPKHLNTPGGSKEIPEGIEEVVKETSRPGSPQPEPGTIKTKLAFFESLKSKFSHNSGKNKEK